MFVDIRDSSRIQETLSPDLIVEFLNVYLGLAAQAIASSNGEVNQVIGDGLLATFGLRNEADHGAANALSAAEAIHSAFASANMRHGPSEPVRAVVAVHTGVALVHEVEGASPALHAVLGAAVNVTSRLEWEAKEYRLATVVSGATVAALDGGPGLLHLVTRKKLRGFSDVVEIWSPEPSGLEASIEITVARPTEDHSATERIVAGATRLDWRPFASGLFVASVLLSSLIAVMWLRSGEAQFGTRLMNLVQPGVAVGAAVTCAWKARRSRQHVRRAWTLIAVSSALWALGQTEADVLQLGVGIAPLSAWFADASFVASLVLAIGGVLCFWTTPLPRYGLSRAVLDGLIVCSSLTFALWALGVERVASPYTTYPSAMTEQLLFSAGEIILAGVLILVVNRGARHMQAPLLLLLGSVVLDGIAAVFGAYETKAPDSNIYIDDAVLVVGLLLLALAPLWPVDQHAPKSEDVTDVWQLALPWMAVMVAASGAIVHVVRGDGLDPFLTLLGAIFASLLAASQFLTHRDALMSLRKSRLSEKTLADMIAHSPVGIARVSADLKILAANPSLGVLLREPAGVLAGSAIAKYFPADIQPQIRSSLEELSSGAVEVAEAELPMIRADGDGAWVHVTSTAVKNPTGQVEFFLATLQDTTERHQAEQSSRATLAELETLNRVRTEFLRSISHEFKTALVGIEGFSELLQESPDTDPDEVKQFARDIHGDAERLTKMVSEFVDLDNVQAVSEPVVLGPVDLNSILRAAIGRTKQETDGLTFAATLDPDLPAMVGDEGKLSELVGLLLRNAVRHSPDGGQIKVSSRSHIGQIDITVTDQGLGMRADFDNPLFSGDDLYANNPIRRVVGTGLGLGIARHIVAIHGGRIWMDRLDGIGSEAHATFPLVMTAPLVDPGLRPASAQAS